MEKIMQASYPDKPLQNTSGTLFADDGQDGNQTFLDSELFIKASFNENPRVGCELLFRKYHKILCNHAVKFVYSREVAEDIVSEVFCRFWKTRAYESVNSSYRFYLFRSVRNQTRNHLRLEFQKLEGLEKAEYLESFLSENPDEITQFDELSARVEALVETLPPQCRKIFLMNRFEGIKYKDIASQLNISLKTVEAHMGKALGMMRTGLKDLLVLSLLLIFPGCV